MLIPIKKILKPKRKVKRLDNAILSSIRTIGQQMPVHVRKRGHRYELRDGLQRYLACTLLGHSEIDVFIMGSEHADSSR